ncbi:hypothetical protein ACJMK2_021210 [Sinanodonta woodiana]|uniref:Uncharacterized protein n=1 Tax=Sinanodonta woodiana TaxID=1069815 RepID=A0ABD3U470_SINWO
MSEKNKQTSAKSKEDSDLAFHYTSKEGMKGIAMSGQINASVAGKKDDVTFGAHKVYMTPRHPEKNTRLEIAKNNYDGSPDYAKSKLPSTEYAIGFNAKDIQAKREKDERSIQTVKGDVPLEKAQVIYKKKGDGYEKIWSKSDKK